MNSRLLFVIIFLNICIFSIAQGRFPAIDKSPMDVSFYPANFPILKIQNKISEPLIAKITYSRPQKNGRVVFGELVEYGKVWRLGANEATEIEFFKDVKIGGSKIRKGRYTIYAIPQTDKWTIIMNKETDIWGAFSYDSKKDVLRYDVKVEKTADLLEAFSISFEKGANGSSGYLTMGWDDVIARLPFTW